MRRSTFAARAGLAALALAACGPSSSSLADLSVVDVLPKEVGPGGFQSTIADAGIATGYFFKAPIFDCGAIVLDSARAWAGRHGYTETDGAVTPRAADLTLAADRAGGGTLVVRYTLASDASLGRVWIQHEQDPGMAAPTPQELVSMGLPELVQGELAAARCDMGG